MHTHTNKSDTLAVLKCQAQKRHTEHTSGRHDKPLLLSGQGQGSYHTHGPSKQLACPSQMSCQYQPFPLPCLFRRKCLIPGGPHHPSFLLETQLVWHGVPGGAHNRFPGMRLGFYLFPPRVKREPSPLRGCRAESTGRGGSQPTSSWREPSNYVIHPPWLLPYLHCLINFYPSFETHC